MKKLQSSEQVEPLDPKLENLAYEIMSEIGRKSQGLTTVEMIQLWGCVVERTIDASRELLVIIETTR